MDGPLTLFTSFIKRLFLFMKIVFVANLKNSSASGRQRLWAMQQCNQEVFVLDKSLYLPKLGRFSGPAAKILKQPALMHNRNAIGEELIELCEKVKPDLVWIEWATDLRADILNQLRMIKPSPLLISFQDDNPWGHRKGDKWMWKDYFKIVPLFDLHLVKRKSDIDNLTAIGAKHFKRWRHGVYSPLFHPLPKPVIKKYPVSFVGTCIDDRVELIEHLLENEIPVHVFGFRWDDRSNLPKRFPDNFHTAIEGEGYTNIIHESQICLGLVSHSNNDEWTMRTYEVPGCAGLLLIESTPTHSQLFEADKEVVFFSNPEECVNKLKKMLADPARCMAMGTAAYQKCKQNHWMLEDEMQQLLDEIKTGYLTKN
jgi:spore maturation protein CgeB